MRCNLYRPRPFVNQAFWQPVGMSAGHYADAGEVAALMALTMAATEDVDMVMTGHSLGRNKLEHLLGACSLGLQGELN